jgi:3',5'-cyclic AMP phosphodiesterase CpdA
VSRKRSNSIKAFFILLGLGLVASAVYLGLFSQDAAIQQWREKIRAVVSTSVPEPTRHQSDKALSIAILSDSHQDEQYFPSIVDQIAARNDLDFVAHLGDLSDAGDKNKLDQAKAVLDRITPPVYVLPGDHDYNWFPKHDLVNFKQVFHKQQTYFSLNRADMHFLFIDNSDLNDGIDSMQWSWIKADLERHKASPIFVFMSTPLSNPYLDFKAMGSQSDTVKRQSVQLGQLLVQYPVKAIFAGDAHTFAQYKDKGTQLPIITVGSSGSTKNLLPLYVIVDIFSDGSYNVTSIPYKKAIPVQGSD